MDLSMFDIGSSDFENLSDEETIKKCREIVENGRKVLFQHPNKPGFNILMDKIEKLDKIINDFEISLASEKALELKKIIYEQNMEDLFREADINYAKMKKELQKAIDNGTGDTEKMKKIMEELLQIEKEHGYEPDDKA